MWTTSTMSNVGLKQFFAKRETEWERAARAHTIVLVYWALAGN
jgi:hypothetical protein